MIRKIFLSAAVSVLLVLNSCENNPLIPTEIQPGRRDYVWSVDTLNMPMNWLSSVWGSSPQDVWAVGAGGSEYDRLWHYDGNKWSAYTKEPIWCTGETLFGFSSNNVWMGGGGGWLDAGAGIWHYDGNKWNKNFVYKVEDATIVNITNIWGSQPNDIYACGYIYYNNQTEEIWNGFVLHYDGFSWHEEVRVNFNSQFLRIRKEQNKVYVFSYSMSRISTANDIVTLYELSDNEFKSIYSNSVGAIRAGNFNLIGNKLYFWIDRDVFLYRGGNSVKQFSITELTFDYYLFGRTEKDIFILMNNGLAHYNGKDIQYVFKHYVNQTIILGADILFNKEIFCGVVDFTNNKNLILHGRLKE